MLIYKLFVSGVVLANASLDIAFHDTILIATFTILTSSILVMFKCNTSMSKFSLNTNINYNSSVSLDKKNYNRYIKMFWVGLMDGDGSIQVNHWRSQSLQYRLIIKLSNLKLNYDMLIEIAKVIGGTVRITGRGTDAIWVVDKKQEVEKIIEIYDTYPPLTSKKICQLAYLKTCLSQTSVKVYLLNRNSKYDKQLNIIKSNINFTRPFYFKQWLSGFIEAEGCFSKIKSNNHFFSIGQKDDFYLINAIKQYFRVSNKIRNPYSKFYFLEIYKKEVLLEIITHCSNYPLLGEKSESIKEFKNILFNKRITMLKSGSNKRPLCNNIKYLHTKQFNRGISTELSNNELNSELFPIEFDDSSRAILDLPFILGDRYLKFINKKDNSIISFTSLNHYFQPKKTKSFKELEMTGYIYDAYYNIAYPKKYEQFISQQYVIVKKTKKYLTMSELIKYHLKLDKNHFIYVRVSENTFATLTQAKKHYTSLIKTRLQYLEPIMNEKTLQEFKFERDPFELIKTKTDIEQIKANPSNESKIDEFLFDFLPLLFNKEHGYKRSSQFYDQEKNRSDLQIHYVNKGQEITILIVENKAEKGDSFYDMLSQAPKYSDNDFLIINSYIMTMKGTLASFYAYIQDFHSSNKFCLKGGGVDGLLGLYFDWKSMSVKIVPQINTFVPQAIYYDFSKVNTCIKTKYSILAILNFMSTQSLSPDLNYETIFNFSSSSSSIWPEGQVVENTLNKSNKDKNARLVMKSLIKELKLDFNNQTLNPRKSTKVLGTSKIKDKTFKHIIDFTGKVKLLET